MGVVKQQLKQGNGKDFAKSGDNVTIEYTGFLHDKGQQANGFKGKQ
jgi:FKBP-type peptidyl-prolyl cis-trans isomerase